MISQSACKAYVQTSQKIAEAIESVLKVDVTIMDMKMTRIAGTGIYKKMISEKIEPGTAFEHCLASGKPQLILDVHKGNKICANCPRKHTCNEKAEICVPITYKKRSVGVIGIIAFDENQRDEILIKKDIYLNFLQKMSSLLEAKYAELQMEDENKALSLRLTSILDTMSEGLVVFKDDGDIIYKNMAVKKLLNEMGVMNDEEFMQKIWHHPIIKKMTKQSMAENDPNEMLIEYGGREISLLASVNTLGLTDSGREFIVTLQNLKRIQKKVIQAAEKNQMRLGFDDIIGVSQNFMDVKIFAQKAAHSDSNILITGESGTGKELFARAIHNESLRWDNPFLPINCGAIPDELLESELFGYEKGAFTGAYSTKIGKFEVADNGTLFLDEISEMPYRLQVKLLRVIQEGELYRVGSNKMRKVNVRVISSTNADLLQMIGDDLFREDLYYRLNVVPINIPPLRERKSDILYIAEYFIKYYSKVFNKNINGICKEAAQLFLEYPWPGNVRELQNVIEYAINFETGKVLSREIIEKRLDLNLYSNTFDNLVDGCRGQSLGKYVRQFEKALFEKKIEEYGHNDAVYNICKDLKISRATFYRKIKDLGIVPKSRKS